MRLLIVLGCAVVAGPGVFLSLPARAQPPTPLPQGAQEEPTRLPEVRVTAPARLPGSPLPLSSVPATVDVAPRTANQRPGRSELPLLGGQPQQLLPDHERSGHEQEAHRG